MARDTWQPDVDIRSPDRSVRLQADRAGQLHVELQDLHRHSDESLAGQVRAAARVALAALQAVERAGEFPERAEDGQSGGRW